MNNKQTSYYGWRIVIAGFLVNGVAIGINLNCNAAFIEPVSSALGISISAFAVTFSIASFTAIPCYFAVSKIIKIISIRSFMMISSLCFLVFKVLFGLSNELWQFYLCAAGLGVSMPGISYMAVNTLIDRWFYDKKGMAIGIASSGAGIVGSVFLPIDTWFIQQFGWRIGYIVQAGVGLFMLVLALWLIKEDPSEIGLSSHCNEKAETVSQKPIEIEKAGYTLKESRRMPAFYMMLAGLFCMVIVAMGIQPYIITALGVAGYSLSFATGLMSAILVINTFGKIGLGIIFDKVGIRNSSIIIGSILGGSSLLLLLVNTHIVFTFIFALVYGFAYATTSIPAPYYTAGLFGSQEFTAIYGIVMVICSLGGSIGSALTGIIYDHLGNYRSGWISYIVLSIVVAGLLLFSNKLVMSKKSSAEF